MPAWRVALRPGRRSSAGTPISNQGSRPRANTRGSPAPATPARSCRSARGISPAWKAWIWQARHLPEAPPRCAAVTAMCPLGSVQAACRSSPQAMREQPGGRRGGPGYCAAPSREMSGGVSRHRRAVSGQAASLSRTSASASAGVFQPSVLRGLAVQLVRDRGQVLRGVPGQGRALGEVLAQQPVGVLVAAPLPGRVRVAEVDLRSPRPPRSARARASPSPGPRSATGAPRPAAPRSPASARPPPRARHARRAAAPAS